MVEDLKELKEPPDIIVAAVRMVQVVSITYSTMDLPEVSPPMAK